MFGLLNGFACSFIYFIIVMSVMIRSSNGTNYTSVAIYIWKAKIEDNYVIYKKEEKLSELNSPDNKDETIGKQGDQIAHPLKEEVRTFVESSLMRIASLQKIIEKEKAKKKAC